MERFMLRQLPVSTNASDMALPIATIWLSSSGRDEALDSKFWTPAVAARSRGLSIMEQGKVMSIKLSCQAGLGSHINELSQNGS